MPDKTQEARGRRSQARERRRSSVAEPIEEVEQAESSPGSDASPKTNGALGGAAAKMVGTAVAAALLGALGGAVKGMLERRASPPGDREPDTNREAEPDEDAPDRPSDEAEPESEHDVDVDVDADVEPEQEPQASAREEGERAASDDRGLSEGDAEAVVSTARRHLEALLGTDVERASGLERADGRWSVYLEVVEVARIPESTDVLATYEVVLGDDGDLAGVSRVRRYRRSQVEEEA
jgi:hypothetical protein